MKKVLSLILCDFYFILLLILVCAPYVVLRLWEIVINSFPFIFCVAFMILFISVITPSQHFLPQTRIPAFLCFLLLLMSYAKTTVIWLFQTYKQSQHILATTILAPECVFINKIENPRVWDFNRMSLLRSLILFKNSSEIADLSLIPLEDRTQDHGTNNSNTFCSHEMKYLKVK